MILRRLAHAALLVLPMVAVTGLPGTVSGAPIDGGKRLKSAPVILLHGLGRSSANMLILKWRLESRGYRVCNIGYDTRVDSIEVAADRVYEAVASCTETDRPIHFVTHSLGGIVLRSLLVRHELSTAGRAVMLAPPNRGSEIADWVRDLSISERFLGRLAGQLGTGPADLPRSLPSPRMAFAVIAGDRWINPVGPWLLQGPHDGTVSVASTRLDGMADHLVLPHTHTFIMNAAGVAEQIDAFLRTGRFRRGPASAD
jgi:pimeloyl-ACP methyl ester carboxylesterase